MAEDLTAAEQKSNTSSACKAVKDNEISNFAETKMRSCFSYETVAASEREPLHVLNDHFDQKIKEGCSQFVSGPPSHCIRAAGILRYNRESENPEINLTTVFPAHPPLTHYALKCEYCENKARPSLDLTWMQELETAPLFCCAQRQWLCEMLVKQRVLFEGKFDLKTSKPTPLEGQPATKTEKFLLQGKEIEYQNKLMDLPGKPGTQSKRISHKDYSIQPPVAESFVPSSKVFRFRLSCAPDKESCTWYPSSTAEKCLKNEWGEALAPFCDPKPLQFGICHHQDGTEFLQKCYSNGMKFLTLFRDGAAQVFYPSGLLALIVVVTEGHGRVCIVYDDSDTPSQVVRAVFQSDGRATCYHSNGNIWLSLNRWGGQCLDESGARVRRWSWSCLSLPQTPLQPVFLSINKSVGVRVLGKEQVFVSFLAKGQQARFSVGTHCAQGESKTDGPVSGPSVMMEELFVMAARFKIHLVIHHLHQYLKTPSHLGLPKTVHAPHLRVVAQRLHKVSANLMMDDRERAFIHECLQDCLK